MKDTNSYFKSTIENDGISGDDVNRRLREARLGFAAPSADWDQAGTVIHCIYPKQVPTKSIDSVILYNMHPFGPIGFVAESLDEILAPFTSEKLDGARVAFDHCADLCNEDCKYWVDGVCDVPVPGDYDDNDDCQGDDHCTCGCNDDPICNKCGVRLETDGSCGYLHCTGADDHAQEYHIESAFASVSMKYDSAYKQWGILCQPVCQHNDDDNYCDHYDNHVKECLFTLCPRVCSND